MRRWLSALGRGFASIGQGFASIGRGMASFNIFGPPPKITRRPPNFPRIHRDDKEALNDDWRRLGWDDRQWKDIGDWNDLGKPKRPNKRPRQ